MNSLLYSHAPKVYRCPICVAIKGEEGDATMIVQDDIFYRDDLVVAFVSSKCVEGNEHHAIVAPIAHYENIYALPVTSGHRIAELVQRVACALKKIRQCDGVTIIQNNEPAGDQHALHFHTHIFPRFAGDHLYEALQHSRISRPAERKAHADALREFLKNTDQ